MQKQIVVSDFDSEMQRLHAEHERLELRLRELDRHLSLSPEEQTERANLKKAKLLVKDDLLHLSHQRLRA
jgi:uncharacterized protein YdcH (DUF465 family)